MFKTLIKFTVMKSSREHFVYRRNSTFDKYTLKELFVKFTETTAQCLTARSMSLKKHLDYSKVPKVDSADIDLQYVRGSGPGGQATNKTNNAVIIKHKPTGIVVKCHKTRSMWENEKIAMDNLITKLDNLLNGKDSIEAQTKAHQLRKSTEKDRRRNKLDKLKAAFKEREGLE